MSEAFDRALRPPELKHRPWRRTNSDSWTDAPLRGEVVKFLDEFVKTHEWAVEWSVSERFALGSTSDVNVKVPRGPALLVEQEDFKMRNAVPILIFRVRHRKGEAFWLEVGAPFPDGNSLTGLNRRLTDVGISLEALARGL